MKKLSLVVILLMVSANVYGARGYWEDNSSLPATWTNGYVGIGTEYPYYLLDVDGTARVKGFRLTTGAVTNYVLTCTSSSGSAAWKALPSGGGSCLWNVGYGGIYYNGGSVGIFNLGGSNDVSVLAISENTSTLDEFIFKGDFAGTGETGNALKLESHWADNVMTWRGDGNVGIGTTSPTDKLHINDNNLPSIRISKGSSYWGQLSIATGNGNFSNFATTGDFVLRTDATAEDIIITARNSTGAIRFGTGIGDTEKVTIASSGNVGIGTTNPGDYKLAVNGTIRAKEIKVETGWSDFVFADNYKLMPLDKLENHIKANKSLPGIPTEKEVLENGIELGEMQAKFLEKIEELTLYVIELKKENEELKERISALEK